MSRKGDSNLPSNQEETGINGTERSETDKSGQHSLFINFEQKDRLKALGELLSDINHGLDTQRETI